MSYEILTDDAQQLSDAFNKAFKEWKDSDPVCAEYVRQQGHSITGLHNMLFHFFKAGYEMKGVTK